MSDPIASNVLLAINSKGITLVQLQRRAGVHKSTLSRWLSGRRSIRVRDALAVLEALGLDIVIRERPRAVVLQGCDLQRKRQV